MWVLKGKTGGLPQNVQGRSWGTEVSFTWRLWASWQGQGTVPNTRHLWQTSSVLPRVQRSLALLVQVAPSQFLPTNILPPSLRAWGSSPLCHFPAAPSPHPPRNSYQRLDLDGVTEKHVLPCLQWATLHSSPSGDLMDGTPLPQPSCLASLLSDPGSPTK